MRIEASSYDDILEKHFRTRKDLGLTEAASKEMFYGFQGADVVQVHFHKQGWGAGLFFRLRDGRVIDVGAQEHNPNHLWYDQTTH